MVDNLLFFNKAKMKLHGTEAIKFLFLIAHLDEMKSLLSVYWERNVNLSAISDNCKKQTTKVKFKIYLSFYNL